MKSQSIMLPMRHFTVFWTMCTTSFTYRVIPSGICKWPCWSIAYSPVPIYHKLRKTNFRHSRHSKVTLGSATTSRSYFACMSAAQATLWKTHQNYDYQHIPLYIYNCRADRPADNASYQPDQKPDFVQQSSWYPLCLKPHCVSIWQPYLYWISSKHTLRRYRKK